MKDNNKNYEISRKRDIFLEAEKDYLEELLQNPKMKKFVKELSKYRASDLMKLAEKRMEAIERGEIAAEDLERVEAEITLLMASIKDYEIGGKERELIDLKENAKKVEEKNTEKNAENIVRKNTKKNDKEYEI